MIACPCICAMSEIPTVPYYLFCGVPRLGDSIFETASHPIDADSTNPCFKSR
jgi:hypothetical protein